MPREPASWSQLAAGRGGRGARSRGGVPHAHRPRRWDGPRCGLRFALGRIRLWGGGLRFRFFGGRLSPQ